MESHKVNPVLIHTINMIYTKLLYQIKEYNKEALTDQSYIFTPNHLSDLDGYVIWSLLSKDYDLDLLMYREFWDNNPTLSKLLSLVNIYPITRDRLVVSEIKEEVEKLKNKNHSLIIFPQGRYVDPELMLKLRNYHLETIPEGAFYFSAASNKKFVPVYIEPHEPSEIFTKSVVTYGNPIDPNEYDVRKPNGMINSKNLSYLKEAWLDEINRLYLLSQELENRKMHPYVVKKEYRTAEGKNELIKDPNIIVNYIDEITEMTKLKEETGIEDINELCSLLNLSTEDRENILYCSNIYENNLRRNNKVKKR